MPLTLSPSAPDIERTENILDPAGQIIGEMRYSNRSGGLRCHAVIRLNAIHSTPSCRHAVAVVPDGSHAWDALAEWRRRDERHRRIIIAMDIIIWASIGSFIGVVGCMALGVI